MLLASSIILWQRKKPYCWLGIVAPTWPPGSVAFSAPSIKPVLCHCNQTSKPSCVFQKCFEFNGCDLNLSAVAKREILVHVDFDVRFTNQTTATTIRSLRDIFWFVGEKQVGFCSGIQVARHSFVCPCNLSRDRELLVSSRGELSRPPQSAEGCFRVVEPGNVGFPRCWVGAFCGRLGGRFPQAPSQPTGI